MRKIIPALALTLTLGAGAALIPGCNSAWWKAFEADPIAQVQSFEAAVQIGINAAELAWPAIYAAIPAASQPAAQQQFTNALAAVNHALQALNDGVNAAVIAQQSNPNFTALMQAVSDALSQVAAIVDLYTGGPPATADAGTATAANSKMPAAAAGSVADLHAALKSLTRWGVKVK
jgi:hypothetical protein